MTEYTQNQLLKLYDLVFSELNENWHTNQMCPIELAILHELAAKLCKNLKEVELELPRTNHD
tara:strand:- start:756 stop:941 length:186 start_codon:yes stop_codon:yes gene_type:complete